MTFIFWLQFATVCVAGAMSPGPSLALIIRNSITINRFAGFMTAVGHGLGMGVYAVFAVTGLSIILTANELIFQLIQIIGILFLLYLGFQFIFKKNEEIDKMKFLTNRDYAYFYSIEEFNNWGKKAIDKSIGNLEEISKITKKNKWYSINCKNISKHKIF